MKVVVVPVTHYAQNATIFICEDTRQGVVIDPGGEVEKIAAQLEANNAELVKILLTHGHLDHVGGVEALLRIKKVPVIGPHRDDDFWIQGISQQCQMFGFPPVAGFTPDVWLEDGMQVAFGNVVLDVLHCPGHTPGHVVFYHADSGLLQVGDVIFKGSIGRTDFPMGDHEQLLSSIRSKLYTLPDETVFIPGHGPSSTIGEEKVSNPFVRGE